MASGFPGSIDSFTNPLAASALNSPSHAGQHQDLNDAITKIENYMGLVKVIPTSVVNGTLSATGTVTVGSAVSSVDIRGCFSALYDNYVVSYSNVASSGAGALYCYLLATTTPTASGWYGNTYYVTTAASAALSVAVVTNNAYCECSSIRNGDINSGAFDINSPFLAAYTRVSYSSTASDYFRFGGFTHQATTSYNGVRFAPSTGTITGGTITIYGRRI